MRAGPPRLAVRLLRWLAPGPDVECVVGDLVEEYETTVLPSRGRLAADLWFWRQAMGSWALLSFGRRRSAGAPPASRAGAGRLLRDFVHDLAYAVRSFRSGRSTLLLAGMVLALAIGAGTTTYSVVSGVVMRSLPFDEPERLVMVRVIERQYRSQVRGGGTMSKEAVDLVLSTDGVFESAAYLYGSGQPVLTGLGEPERMLAFTVSPDFFATLGTRPFLGRTLVDEDATAGGTAPAVVSHRFWAERFGGARSALGRTLTLNDRVHEIVGVMPPGFEEATRNADVWVAERDFLYGLSGSGHPAGGYWTIGRLAPDVSIEAALARLDGRFDTYAEAQPRYAEWGASLQPLYEMVVGEVRGPLLLLLGAVALVLLVACANVAAVLLARGVARRREVAVRLSLGAGRGRVARQLIMEATLLSVGAGLAGMALALWAVPVSVSLAAADLPRAAEIGVDWGVLGVALAASLATGVVAGVLPAVLSVRESVVGGLKDGAAGSGVSSWRIRLGEGLVVVQIGLGTLLMVGAVLLVTTFVNLTTVDFGFEPARVVVAELVLPAERYDDPAAREAFAERVFERTRAHPGVDAVAASTGIPFSGGAVGSVELPGGDAPEGAPWTWFTHVTEDYFDVLGLRLVRGSWLPEGVEDAILVDEAFVRAYFPGTDPLGRSVTFYGSVGARIVGVVSDAIQEQPDEPPPPHIYPPIGEIGRRVKIVLRTGAGSSVGPGTLRDLLREVDPLLPIDRIGTLRDLAWETVTRQRFYATALGTFSVVALLITALGVYGISAYSVSRRLREIGIRMALGASGRRMRSRALGRAVTLGALGTLLGLSAASWSARLLETLVFGLSPTEPLVFVLVAMALASMAVLAAYPPARRAARVDPMEVLRAE